MLLRPRVLLLDDFLAGLDRTRREAAGSILSSVAAFASVIVTGHELADLAKWSTRFLVLRDGVIAARIPASGVAAADLVQRVDAALKGGAA
jgi:energy-coupling factor transporter ATP-binding protein EcfA2